MRPEAEIRAVRAQLDGQYLAGATEVKGVLTVLDWVVDELVPHQAVLDVIDEAVEREREDEPEPRADDVLTALTDVVLPGNLVAAERFLSMISSMAVAEIAAAARKVDRMCKVELKKRS